MAKVSPEIETEQMSQMFGVKTCTAENCKNTQKMEQNKRAVPTSSAKCKHSFSV